MTTGNSDSLSLQVKHLLLYLQTWVTNATLERLKKEREELNVRIAATKRDTEEKDKTLAALQEERKKHLAEVFEMK